MHSWRHLLRPENGLDAALKMLEQPKAEPVEASRMN
jgi:hypothetical protein